MVAATVFFFFFFNKRSAVHWQKDCNPVFFSLFPFQAQTAQKCVAPIGDPKKQGKIEEKESKKKSLTSL